MNKFFYSFDREKKDLIIPINQTKWLSLQLSLQSKLLFFKTACTRG